MKVVDRLAKYLEMKGITPRAFEENCGLSNGYFGKQLKTGGSIGSDILEKVGDKYPDLNLVWLITGRGKIIVKPPKGKEAETNDIQLQEEAAAYAIRDRLIEVLKGHIETLSSTGTKKYRAKRKK